MRRIDRGESSPTVILELEGEPLPAREGEPVACALLAAGEHLFSRSVKYHRPRGPYCMSGSCSHCLMNVDGVPNLYTCQVPARQGMRLERQNSYPTAKVDIFASIDWLFPRGLDHHEMFAGVPVAEQVMAKVARHLAGLGLLPKEPAPERPAAEVLRTRVAIAGGGAAGLAAAGELAGRGIPFYLCEREEAVGGRWTSGAPEADARPQALHPSEKATVRVKTTAIGLYEDEAGQFLVALTQAPDGPRLTKVYAESFLLAVGGHPALLPFENNDLPGIYAGRAASLLLRKHGLVVGERVVLAGRGEELYALAKRLTASGSEIAALVDVQAKPPGSALPGSVRGTLLKAHGTSRVSAVTFESAGKQRRVKCDAVVVSLPPSPSFELARQGGARVNFHPGLEAFAVEADADGRTQAKTVFVAGELVGEMSAAAAAESGRRAARAILGAAR